MNEVTLDTELNAKKALRLLEKVQARLGRLQPALKTVGQVVQKERNSEF